MQSPGFDWPIRVYYEDTDAAGIVYYANYLKFLERGRTEWLRSLGFDQSELSVDPGVVFAVRSVSIEYLKPARFDDRLTVRTRIGQAGRVSLEFVQQILRGDAAGDAELLTGASVKVACLDARRMRPRALPAALVKELSVEH